MKKSTILNFLDVLLSNLRCCLLSKTKVSKSNFLRFDIRTVLPFIFMAIAMTSFIANAQVPAKKGDVPVAYPNGGFAVDGDAYARTPIDAVGDWWINPLSTVPPRSVFYADGSVVAPLPPGTEVVNFIDQFRGDGLDDLTTFPRSNKINDNPNSYEVGIGNVTPKDDMQHAIAVFTMGDPTLTTPTYATTGDASDIWCLFAADRWRTNGSSYNDFEFNQNTMILGSNGFIVSSAPTVDDDGDPTGGRTPGDILVTIEYVNGGGFGQIYVDRWDKDGIGQNYYWKAVDLSLPQYVNTIFVTPNLAAELSPWPIYDQPVPYTYAINQYSEGAINLSDIFGANDLCGAVATVWARTKSSHSNQAELMDLAGIAQLNVGPPDLVATCAGDVTMQACSTPEQINTAFATWKTGFSNTGGVPPVEESYTTTGGAPVNMDALSPPNICGGTVSVTYTVTDFCEQTDSCTATFTVTAPTAIGYTNPVSGDLKSCDFANQAAVDSAFTDWIAAQILALEGSITGGCDPKVSNGGGTAPVLCEGGTATVTWTITDLCETISTITADFKLTAPTAIGYANAVGGDLKSCDFANQAAVDSAFTDWIAAQTLALEGSITGGCDPKVSNGGGTAPVLCEGGTATVTWTITDLCETISTITADFKLTAPTAIGYANAVGGDLKSCDFANQAAVDSAFTDWIAAQTLALEGSITGGCDPKVSNGGGTAPLLCEGGTSTVTWTITDLCETISTITADFKLTAPDPLVISDVKDLLIPGCTYGTQEDLDTAFASWLKGFNVTGGCSPKGVFAETYTAPDRTTGGFVDVVYNVTDLCENGSDTARYTVEPCVNAHCTYTQGYYGNLGGISCADGEKYTTTGLIAKALASYGGTMTIGLPGHSVFMTAPDDIIRVLPGGGSSYALSAGNINISASGFSAYLRKGNINNTLLAQTITLGLNLGIDGSLGDFELNLGKFYTAEPANGCGSDIPKARQCVYNDQTGYFDIINEYKDWSINPKVVNALGVNNTVDGLFALANQALGGGSTNGLTLSEIASAVDKINNAFDGCRIFMGYDVEPLVCSIATIDTSTLSKTASSTEAGFEAYPIPFKDVLTIRYKFNYTSEVKIEVFNSNGILMLTKTDSNGYLDKEITLNLNSSSEQEQVYVVKVTTNRGNSSKKVMSSK